jgi:carbamoyltransferase
MKDKLVISAYGSHNAAIAMFYKGEYKVVEVERWLNSKNIGLTGYMPSRHPQIVFDEITEFLLSQTDRSDADILITGYLNNKMVTPKFHVKKTIACDHHTAHAADAFYQSPYKEALVFTFDGGGDGGYFNVYLADRKGGIKLVDKFNQDLGFPYMVICDHLKDIKKEALSIGNLVYAGKVMGLCSYGKIREEWVPHFDEFYSKFNYVGNALIGGGETRHDAVTALFKALGAEDFDIENSRYDGEFAWDIAATSQKSFENQFFKYAQKYLDMYPDLPVALAGGCALNVLLNSKLLKLRNNKVFVPPNVSDCGIAAGALLWYMEPEGQIDLTYSGTPILDKNQFGTYVQEHDLEVYENVTVEELAEYLANGHIVGMIQGNSEHGSRALGNRSILCAPGEGMKDILNHKVKHREWYRPFAPICRLEDVSKYFEFDDGVESRHMVFVANVREEWRSTLPAITHQDNTARLQTVTKSQNPLIYDLITEFEKHSGYGVILNTSFNVDGKPILTRLSDAFTILRGTQLDAVYYEGKLILRSNNKTFKQQKQKLEEKKLTDDTTVYVMSFKENEDEIKADIEIIKTLASKNHKIVLIVANSHINHYKNELPESNNFKYYPILRLKHHFYEARLKNRFGFDTSSTIEYAKLVKLLWCKDILKENLFNTNYQLFVNLDELANNTYEYNIARDVDLLSQFAKNDDYVVITSKKDHPSIFDKEYIQSKKKVNVEHYPTSALFCGNVENMSWMLANYEGMLLHYMDNGKIGKEHDYILMSSVENMHRYKFLDS